MFNSRYCISLHVTRHNVNETFLYFSLFWLGIGGKVRHQMQNEAVLHTTENIKLQILIFIRRRPTATTKNVNSQLVIKLNKQMHQEIIDDLGSI